MKKSILSVFVLLLSVALNAQAEKGKTVLDYGIGYNYIFSSQKTNISPSNTLFGGNGHSFNISFSAGKVKGSKSGVSADSNGQITHRLTNEALRPSTTKIEETQRKLSSKLSLGVALKIDASFQTGTTSNKDLEAFAKILTAPNNYKITLNKTNWQQFVIMGGPSFVFRNTKDLLFPRINISTGAAFRFTPRATAVIKIRNAVTDSTVFNQNEKAIVFAWQANISIPVAKLGKRLNLCLEGGYGFNGGTLGVDLQYRFHKQKTGFTIYGKKSSN